MSKPVAYQEFHLQYIAGEWRQGRSGRSLEDRAPYDQQLLTTIPLANREDLDDAYTFAAQAQRAWAAAGPAS